MPDDLGPRPKLDPEDEVLLQVSQGLRLLPSVIQCPGHVFVRQLQSLIRVVHVSRSQQPVTGSLQFRDVQAALQLQRAQRQYRTPHTLH